MFVVIKKLINELIKEKKKRLLLQTLSGIKNKNYISTSISCIDPFIVCNFWYLWLRVLVKPVYGR